MIKRGQLGLQMSFRDLFWASENEKRWFALNLRFLVGKPLFGRSGCHLGDPENDPRLPPRTQNGLSGAQVVGQVAQVAGQVACQGPKWPARWLCQGRLGPKSPARGPGTARGKPWYTEGPAPGGPERPGANPGTLRGRSPVRAGTADLCPGAWFAVI